MFGNLLTEEASILAGLLGMRPCAWLGEGHGGVFEPIHGSAPARAGLGVSTPIAAILSAAMLLRYALGLEQEARAIEGAAEAVLDEGHRTLDIYVEGTALVGAEEMGDLIAARI